MTSWRLRRTAWIMLPEPCGRGDHGAPHHQAYMLDGSETWDAETARYQAPTMPTRTPTARNLGGPMIGGATMRKQRRNPMTLKEKLQQAQQAESVAESLAAEAHRTWAEAQRATQALWLEIVRVQIDEDTRARASPKERARKAPGCKLMLCGPRERGSRRAIPRNAL